MILPPRCIPGRCRAFSLVEILVAVAVTSLLLVVLLGVVSQTTRTMTTAGSQMSRFQSARNALNLMEQTLAQATLNTFLDYDDTNSPTRYLRQSAQRLVIKPAGVSGIPGTSGCGQGVFFQAPAAYATTANLRGADGLLNVCGFFVEFGPQIRPPHVKGTAPSRYQLKFLLTSAEANTVFQAAGDSWFTTPASGAVTLADNVIALILRPQDPSLTTPDLTTNFVYDTGAWNKVGTQPAWSHQLPPMILVTMIVLDKRSAERLENGTAQPAVITSALNKRFEKVVDYVADLKAVELALQSASPPVDYRVFTLTIPLRESKWSP